LSKSGFWIVSLFLCSFAAGQVAAPAPQTPQEQNPQPPVSPSPTSAKATPAPKPAKPPAPPRENIEDMLSVSVFYWLPKGQPGFRAGHGVADPQTGELDLTKDPNRGNGVQITFPTGGFNRLEIGYWRLYDSGDVISPHKVSIFGADIQAGERLNTQYKASNLRAAWNYLTFPVPPLESKLRIKTFWEIQWTKFDPTIGFPDVPSNPAPITPTQNIFYPGAGIGAEYIWKKYFRVEARGSGMGFPGRSHYWDLEASAIGRIKSHLEIYATWKGFGFRSSPKNETYIQGMYTGPMLGVRWVFRK
jgi:hypothetical protein